MMPTARRAASRDVGSCRECPVRCDRVVYPASCLASGCARLYSYEEGGRTYIGCLQGVFGVEIDLERLRDAEASPAGFGALRARRAPLPVCHCEIDRTFAHRAEGPCINPEFLGSAPAWSGWRPVRTGTQ